jgi:hypothetical protein
MNIFHRSVRNDDIERDLRKALAVTYAQDKFLGRFKRDAVQDNSMRIGKVLVVFTAIMAGLVSSTYFAGIQSPSVLSAFLISGEAMLVSVTTGVSVFALQMLGRHCVNAYRYHHVMNLMKRAKSHGAWSKDVLTDKGLMRVVIMPTFKTIMDSTIQRRVNSIGADIVKSFPDASLQDSIAVDYHNDYYNSPYLKYRVTIWHIGDDTDPNVTVDQSVNNTLREYLSLFNGLSPDDYDDIDDQTTDPDVLDDAQSERARLRSRCLGLCSAALSTTNDVMGSYNDAYHVIDELRIRLSSEEKQVVKVVYGSRNIDTGSVDQESDGNEHDESTLMTTDELNRIQAGLEDYLRMLDTISDSALTVSLKKAENDLDKAVSRV